MANNTPYTPDINSDSADFVPSMGDYRTLQPFRYWCQKVLPLVYDESLSYYELLCKVVDYLNKTMEDVETLHDDVDDLHSAYSQLQGFTNTSITDLRTDYKNLVSYVNNYFNTLDVQTEINNKLDAMALNGSLTALMSPYIPNAVAAWLAEHITPTTPAIDASLSVEGAAADAKATGDAIKDLSMITGVDILYFADGFIEIPAVGKVCDITRVPYTARKSAVAPISNNPVVTVKVDGAGTNAGGARAWAFLDSDYKVLTRAAANITEDGELLVPENASYIVLNTKTDTIAEWYGFTGRLDQNAEIAEAVNAATLSRSITENITESNTLVLRNLDVRQMWVDVTLGVLDNSTNVPPRLVVVPVEENTTIYVSIPHLSTKRVAFADTIADQAPAYNAQEFTGALETSFKNTNHKYFVIQLFINSDRDQDYTNYFTNAEISILTTIDSKAREEIKQMKEGGGSSILITENLKGLPILNSFNGIEIITSAYDDCAAFHALVKSELCDPSNGYLVQTLLGNDGHGNNLYKYVSFPEELTFGANRRFGTPDYPITGGKKTPLFTVIITTNIHGIEHGGNWVVYNMLKKMQTANTDMLRFFRDNVKIIWIPYICASGDYENADGVNINRDFPTSASGTCESAEAAIVKGVIDEYAPSADMHIDIHTFRTTGTYAQHFSTWTFTDSEKFGYRSVKVSKSVVERYAEKYPDINLLQREVVSAINTPTTCTYYTQTVYGIPAGTIEGALSMSGSPEGADSHTSATAYLYDIITQFICAMATSAS